MKRIDPDLLDMMIARAKSSGEQIWYQIKNLSLIMDDSTPTEEAMSRAYDRYASMCEGFGSESNSRDPELGELLTLEMFLRAGKRMPIEAKTKNRKRADELKEKILRRK